MYDLTLPIDDRLPIYPGDPAPRLERVTSIDRGDHLNLSSLSTGCHVGTHLDVPLHFLASGEDVASLAADRLIGKARVVDIAAEEAIARHHLEPLGLPRRTHLLFRTPSGHMLHQPAFRADYVCMAPAAAKYLLELEPLSIGIDTYSLDPADSTTFPAHRTLAERGVPVVVCLDLQRVPSGDYLYACLPLRLPGADGSPVRAVLFEKEEWLALASDEHQA
ncbi:Kynurenine formamidase [Planctomycetes bacterium Pan216]|uniref:Kynurenine formamidase n=1 Tax=Kolteria novifilia TaxID=2527975 RepID=A0A518B841_9BACT|nr:Kynurenine formamidase [Planctomycetes bacterium Pan216]